MRMSDWSSDVCSADLHPLDVGDWYRNQKEEAVRRARAFREKRMPKFLGWFESVLERNPTGTAHLVGARLSYADLSLFQLVEGLRSDEHTSELQSLMRISYAVFCLQKKKKHITN